MDSHNLYLELGTMLEAILPLTPDLLEKSIISCSQKLATFCSNALCHHDNRHISICDTVISLHEWYD